MENYKLVFGIVAIVVGLISYMPYILGAIKKEVKPSAASWMVWGLLTSVAFGDQLSSGGGVGSMITGLSAVISFVIMALAFKNSDQKFSRLDWACLICSLAAITLWLLDNNALLSVALVSGVTLIGYIPTYIKSIKRPGDENVPTYTMGVFKFAFSIAALGTLSTTTILYPAIMILANIGLISLILVRQYQQKPGLYSERFIETTH